MCVCVCIHMGDRAEEAGGREKMGKENADEERKQRMRETAWNITRKLSQRRKTNVRKSHAPMRVFVCSSMPSEWKLT